MHALQNLGGGYVLQIPSGKNCFQFCWPLFWIFGNSEIEKSIESAGQIWPYCHSYTLTLTFTSLVALFT